MIYFVIAQVTLSNLADGYRQIDIAEDVDNRNCFTYFDSEGFMVELCLYEDGLCLFRQSEDHILELHLKDDCYAKITASEGIIRIEAKVIAFERNDDILEMHYLIDNDERVIEIKYL